MFGHRVCMPSLLLLPELTRDSTSLSQPLISNTAAQARCMDITHCRTVLDIVWSSLATIFACAWVAVHRNVPDPGSGSIRVNLERVIITICALLVPEYIIGWALRQRLMAVHIARKNAKLSKTARDDYITTLPKQINLLLDDAVLVENNWEKKAQEVAKQAKEAGGWRLVWYRFQNKFFPDDDHTEWTITHGFFVLMGGFYFLDPGETPHPLSPEEVEEYVKAGALELPKKSDINDKSKGDAFSKAVASLQTAWFVLQSIARPIQGLPLTEIEVVTLAYTAIHVTMLIIWWSKPLSVKRPVRVRRRRGSNIRIFPEPGNSEPPRFVDPLAKLLKTAMGAQDDDVDLSQVSQVPAFYAGKPEEMKILVADTVALMFAMVFGAVHCIAWSFVFPTDSERLAWRIASVVLIGVPAIYIALIVLYAFERKTLAKYFLLLSLVGIPFYIVARMALFVIAFTTLRSPHPAALETVHWTTFIPHF
ncbi:hypothetical protein HWV62_26626 [Athelia sp. TMB]|nr:hypothetical protein HWV62_26626 [Athelia sp. TMB]